MKFPDTDGVRIPANERVPWYGKKEIADMYRTNDSDILCRSDFIREWNRRGYQTPEGGWDLYEIHHILPREFGGTNDFDNLTPLIKYVHRSIVTPWWNNFGLPL